MSTLATNSASLSPENIDSASLVASLLEELRAQHTPSVAHYSDKELLEVLHLAQTKAEELKAPKNVTFLRAQLDAVKSALRGIFQESEAFFDSTEADLYDLHQAVVTLAENELTERHQRPPEPAHEVLTPGKIFRNDAQEWVNGNLR